MRWIAVALVLCALIGASTAIWIEQHPHRDGGCVVRVQGCP